MFAETKLDFSHSHEHYLEQDRFAMQRFEEARKEGGSVILFVDYRDSDCLPTPHDEDNGFHYALVGCVLQDPDSLFLAEVMPLPRFAVIMGWVEEQIEDMGEYGKINKSFDEIVGFFQKEFQGNTFFGSRSALDRGEYMPETILLLPEANLQTMNLIRLMGPKSLENVDPWIEKALVQIRLNDPPTRLLFFVFDDEVIQLMSRLPDIRRLGMPQAPQTPPSSDAIQLSLLE